MEDKNKQFKVAEINAKDLSVLDSFVAGNSSLAGAEFLQSSLWLNVLKMEKKSARIFAVWRDKEIVASILITEKVFAKFFSYLYAPRGPIFKKDLSASDRNLIFQELKSYFLSFKKHVFLRFEPVELEDFFSGNKSSLSFVKTIDLQPKKTLLLDLKKSDDELLSEMHQKTRYNIRLARKKNLQFSEAASSSSFNSDFSDFWRLMNKTASRDAFGIHNESHYRNLLLADPLNIKLYFIEYESRRIAAGIFAFFGDKATYLHGASDDEYKNLMAPYLLQFEVIKIARAKGYSLYDFYGIDEEKWPGVTRFKNGFGGFAFSYAGTYDLVFKKNLYFLYLFLRKLRRLF